MVRNYVAAALRNLAHNRLYAAINIIGLALGLGAALLIALFVRDEFSYERWIPGHERIYRIAASAVLSNRTYTMGLAPIGAAPLLQEEFPEIEAITRFVQDAGARSVRRGDIEFLEKVYWADPNIFDVLPLPAFAGDLAAALRNPDGLVLTRAMARKYFGRDDPIGETIEIGRRFSMRVAAVMEDLPSNTHFDMAIIASGLSAEAPSHYRDATIPTSSASTYLRLAADASAERLREGLPGFNQRHPEFQKPEYPWFLDELVPIRDIHLMPPEKAGSMNPSGNAATATYALMISILIVAVAGINFVNLTTARAVRRAVEVGVRKTSGALRLQLIAQFVGESVAYAVLGMAAACAFAALMLPWFNGVLQRSIVFDLARDPTLLGAMVAASLVVGLLAGFYPAFVLSRFAPAAVLSGRVAGGFKGGHGRQVLVAAQFAILIVLGLVSMAVYRQAHYAMNEALRFDKDQMLLISGTPCAPAFVAEIRALPGVRGTACSSRSIVHGTFPADVAGPSGAKINTGESVVDLGYFELYGLAPAAGRFFSEGFAGDVVPAGTASSVPPAVVINEALGRALGYAVPADAVGQTVRWTPRTVNFTGGLVEGASRIIGVVPDFARGSVREAPTPQIFWVTPAAQRVLNVKLAGREVPETLSAIDALWKQFGPPRPITRSFLDQQIEDLYGDVTRLTKMLTAFAAVAVFVAGLGLFGLAAFSAERRTKEIGVRKALGAGKADILRLLLWEFSKPVLWASLIGWPLAFFIVDRWLQGFAARVEIGLWTFPAVSALALLIAVATVIGHALLVARGRPVAALRYE